MQPQQRSHDMFGIRNRTKIVRAGVHLTWFWHLITNNIDSIMFSLDSFTTNPSSHVREGGTLHAYARHQGQTTGPPDSQGNTFKTSHTNKVRVCDSERIWTHIPFIVIIHLKSLWPIILLFQVWMLNLQFCVCSNRSWYLIRELICEKSFNLF